ncbi:MAG: hypothetical protein AB7N91_33070, partial [Candidatus Tectimicrobiota bacterium]
ALCRTPPAAAPPCGFGTLSASPARPPGDPRPCGGVPKACGPPPAPPIVLPEDVRAVHAQPERLHRLAQARHDHVTTGRLQPVGEARPALRGVQGPVAITMSAAAGERTRGEHPRERMRV